MAKLKPIGIPPEDREDPVLKVVPERVQKLIDLYADNHVEYPWVEEDKLERTFEYRRSLKQDSYKYDILSIYRVRDLRDKSKEYYFYQKKGRVLNDKVEPDYEYSLSHTYGYAIEKQHGLKWNDKIRSKEPSRIRDNPTYFYKWDKEEVKKLLDGSDTPCLNFTIGYMGSAGQGDIPILESLSVKNQQDFIEGDFEDLVILNKSGIMDTFGPSLQNLERARKRMEERTLDRLEKVTNPK